MLHLFVYSVCDCVLCCNHSNLQDSERRREEPRKDSSAVQQGNETVCASSGLYWRHSDTRGISAERQAARLHSQARCTYT